MRNQNESYRKTVTVVERRIPNDRQVAMESPLQLLLKWVIFFLANLAVMRWLPIVFGDVF